MTSTTTLPRELIREMYMHARQHGHTDSDDDDEEDDDEEYYDDEGYHDGCVSDELGAMLGEMLTSFVTSPDFDKGFRYSGKVSSHHRLEEQNEMMRRRLAGILASVSHPLRGGARGLLENEFVLQRAEAAINSLGQETDELSERCRAAKRGDPELTERTERLHHRVGKLENWLEWLKMPTPPKSAAPGIQCLNPQCPCSSFHCMSDEMSPRGPDESECALRQAEQERKAADEAMIKLLQEEEDEKRIKREKAREKAQRKKARKKNAAALAKSGQSAKSKGAVSKASSAPTSESLESHVERPDACPAASEVNSELTQHVHNSFELPVVSRDVSQDVSEMKTSAFRALELLSDDEHPGAWSAAPAKTKRKNTDTLKPKHPASPAASTPPPLKGAAAPSPAPDAPAADPDTLGEACIRKAAQEFTTLVKAKGQWDHNWLVNALNPTTASHDATVRESYKALHKLVQQHIWRSIPRTSPSKPRASLMPPHTRPGSSLGMRPIGKPTQPAPRSPAAAAAAPDARGSMSAAAFLKLVSCCGITHHTALTNALNPVSATHDAAVRGAYKKLAHSDVRLVWEAIPKHAPDQAPAAAAAPLPSARAARSPMLSVANMAAPHASQPPCPTSPFPALNANNVPAPAASLAAPAVRGAGLAGGRLFSSAAARPVSRMGSRPVGGSAARKPAPGLRPQGLTAAGQCALTEEGPHSVLEAVPSWSSQQGCGVFGDDEATLCCVCLDKPRDALLQPCGHAVMCLVCAAQVLGKTGECPYCRVRIENVVSTRPAA